jgi:hypothetical protein
MEVRMAGREREQAGYDGANAEACRHAHPQQSTKFVALANAVLSLIERGKDWLHPCEKLDACLGRHNGARGPRKKPGSEVRLEIGDYARGLGLRETAFTRCSREAAESRNARIELEGEYVLHCTNR